MIIVGMYLSQSYGAESGLDIIQRAEAHYAAVKSACSGISDAVSKVSGIAKANTAVNAVGVATSGGALIAGVTKTTVDADIERLMNELCELGACKAETIKNMDDNQILNVADKLARINELSEQVKEKQEKSKSLGNWRTGLIAGSVATNVASAIISGINRDKSELVQQIEACNLAVSSIKNINMDFQKAGLNPNDNPVIKKLNTIATWCGNLDEKSVEKIEKQMTAVMGTSIAGAAVGTAGVAVSASAKGDKAQDKTLNNTANVLSGVSVATGAVGIGLNVSMIKTAKDIIKQSERCEEVL